MNCKKVRELLAFDVEAAIRRPALRSHCRNCPGCDRVRQEEEQREASFAQSIAGALSGVELPAGLFASVRQREQQEVARATGSKGSHLADDIWRWLPRLAYAAVSIPIAILLLVGEIRHLAEAPASELISMMKTRSAGGCE